MKDKTALIHQPHDEVDGQSDRWDKSRVGFRLPSQADIDHRDEAKSQVADPTWANEELRRIHGGDNMAEGQGEAIDDEEVEVDEGAIEAERRAHDGRD